MQRFARSSQQTVGNPFDFRSAALRQNCQKFIFRVGFQKIRGPKTALNGLRRQAKNRRNYGSAVTNSKLPHAVNLDGQYAERNAMFRESGGTFAHSGGWVDATQISGSSNPGHADNSTMNHRSKAGQV
jgi:hypothetical protein